MSCVLPTIVPHFLQSVNSKFAKEPTFCVLFLCAKGNKVVRCGSVAKFACSPQGNALQAQMFKTRHPWCKICVATRCVANGIVIVWFAKMPPRGAVFVVL